MACGSASGGGAAAEAAAAVGAVGVAVAGGDRIGSVHLHALSPMLFPWTDRLDRIIVCCLKSALPRRRSFLFCSVLRMPDIGRVDEFQTASSRIQLAESRFSPS